MSPEKIIQGGLREADRPPTGSKEEVAKG